LDEIGSGVFIGCSAGCEKIAVLQVLRSTLYSILSEVIRSAKFGPDWLFFRLGLAGREVDRVGDTRWVAAIVLPTLCALSINLGCTIFSNTPSQRHFDWLKNFIVETSRGMTTNF
jgi:hypothetical protein